MNDLPLLSLLVVTPWVGAALLGALRGSRPQVARWIALAFSLSTLALVVGILAQFDPVRTNPQLVERHPWFSALNAYYHLGIDGLSLVLVLLTGIITPLALLASWRIKQAPRLLGSLFLALQGSALGVFLALDFFHWFLFWELSLVPAFFLIKLWGGPDATRAAYQFVIYTIGGSAFLLLGFAAIFAAVGTLDFLDLAQHAADGLLAERLAAVGGGWPVAVFAGVLLGFAVKVPLWPFHTWLAPTYTAAPTGVAMFLTAVLSKMGVYGFLRILWPLFPQQLHTYATPLLWLALGGVVLGAFAAMRQRDLKRMIAYSSLNHLSYCLLALFAVALGTGGERPTADAATAALSGTILQLFNHGLSAAALFYCIGILESRSGGLRGLHDFGGTRTAAPIFAGLCGVALFSSLGLPGLNGFVGEFLIFRGVFGLAPWAAVIACVGLLITALFLLTFWQRVFHGPRAGGAAGEFSDVSGIEYAVLVPLVALMIILGVYPQLLAGLINPLVTQWAGHLVLP